MTEQKRPGTDTETGKRKGKHRPGAGKPSSMSPRHQNGKVKKQKLAEKAAREAELTAKKAAGQTGAVHLSEPAHTG
uniref:IncF plasmid conjugative transfer fertility inhibition protein FinO n=1 Tax=Escherichia coli TaxID=562 RepID=A0A3Q8VKW8_ECOLX|nr:IncF plasmid conjugative transfer fertility inhibition protein FinO [Escherichia coli]